MPRSTTIALKRRTLIAIAAVTGLIVASIAAPATALALAQVPDNAGPLYFWSGIDLRPFKGPASGAGPRQGMIVERVQRASPAARAKLKPGDLITGLDGIAVGSPRALAIAIADHCCDPIVVLSVWRGQHRYRIELPPR